MIAYKKVGETPLECLGRVRTESGISANMPMTYAGRLDPMAEGVMIILVGDECKNKEKYLGLDKEYEVEIVFGISTDTYDALGMAQLSKGLLTGADTLTEEVGDLNSEALQLTEVGLKKYVGKFEQDYPAYSSKTFRGEQLHSLARKGELPEEMPTKEVEIYSIDLLGQRVISAAELKEQTFKSIDLVKGDFRQEMIKRHWKEVLDKPSQEFKAVKILVKCSSGTYMRSLADRIGKDMRTGAFALTIKRTRVISSTNPV